MRLQSQIMTYKSLVGTGRVIIGRYREDCPRSERPRISIAHPGRAWAACGPTKRPTFSWWNVQIHSIYRQCCILTKFRFIIKYTCFYVYFFQALICFLYRKRIMQWINAPASCERKLDCQFLTYVSSSISCIKTICLISIKFTKVGQLHIPYTFTKVYANWMTTSNWFLCLKNGHYFCMHRFADKHTRWPTLFRKWFCNSEANRHEICTRLRQRVKSKVWRISH